MDTRVALLALVLLAPLARGAPRQDPPASPPAPAAAIGTPEEQVEALVKEFDDAQAQFGKLYRAAATDAERQKLVEESYPTPKKFTPRFRALAEAHPRTAAARRAWVWIAGAERSGDEFDRALDRLQADHLGDPELAALCPDLIYAEATRTEPFLRALLEKSEHRAVRGQACYALAAQLGRRAEQAGERSADPSPAVEQEKLLVRVTEEFADLAHWRGTLGDAARGDLFELRELAIGKTAPEIEGEDIDAAPFKLSDYRGKVVVLDFWGNW